jgi:hypothetical protein
MEVIRLLMKDEVIVGGKVVIQFFSKIPLYFSLRYISDDQ